MMDTKNKQDREPQQKYHLGAVVNNLLEGGFNRLSEILTLSLSSWSLEISSGETRKSSC